jgi:hypothetical protein
MTRRASFAPPASFDPKTLSCTAIVASAAPVRRSGPAPDSSPESWTEILSIDAGSIDMDRLTGAPVLLAHDPTRHVGVVTAARIERGQLVADLKFSPRADVAAIIDDIGAGILRQCSAGYRVERWRKTPAGWLAERWQPLEVSLLPIAVATRNDKRSGPRFSVNFDAHSLRRMPASGARYLRRNARSVRRTRDLRTRMHGGRNNPCQQPVSPFVSLISITECEKNGR